MTNPESFFTWADLASYAGATLAVLIITQFTKELADKYKKSETAIKEVFRLGDRILLRAAKMSATK